MAATCCLTDCLTEVQGEHHPSIHSQYAVGQNTDLLSDRPAFKALPSLNHPGRQQVGGDGISWDPRRMGRTGAPGDKHPRRRELYSLPHSHPSWESKGWLSAPLSGVGA